MVLYFPYSHEAIPAFCGLDKLEEDRVCHKLFDYNSKKHSIVQYSHN